MHPAARSGQSILSSIPLPSGFISSVSRMNDSTTNGRRLGTGALAKFESEVTTPLATSTLCSIRCRCSACFCGLKLRAFRR